MYKVCSKHDTYGDGNAFPFYLKLYMEVPSGNVWMTDF
jgi:hypothetical protein